MTVRISLTKKAFGSVAVLILVIVSALLAVDLEHKMRQTAVSAQHVEPIAAPAATSGAAIKSQASIVIVGDFTTGSNGGGFGDKNWTAVLGAIISANTPVQIIAGIETGGSGYVVRGNWPTIPEQVKRVVTPDTKVVIISGSRSDLGVQPPTITAAATGAYATITRVAKNARVVVIGPTWGASAPTDDVLATRDAVREAAIQSGAVFVDPIEAQWFTNGDQGLIGSDGTSPTDLGHKKMAEQMAPIILPQLIDTQPTSVPAAAGAGNS